MLISHLHFSGDCADAIALYEKAFDTKAYGYDIIGGRIAHARMDIQGQPVWLNEAREHLKDGFGVECVSHLFVTFKTPEELLACYEHFKPRLRVPAVFGEAPYCKLGGNFLDDFGVLWGFMTEQ